MNKAILFAGVVGCSKSPTASYLSYKLNFPIINNDNIRTEVVEDMGAPNKEEYIKRRNERLMELLASKHDFIFDASIDRIHNELLTELKLNGYEYFIIIFNLSKEFVKKLYEAKGYLESLERIDVLFSEHEEFLKQNTAKDFIEISDKDFPHRLKIAYTASKKWVARINNS